ncbi:MAG: phytanoyl-CoA dioxygenase family protein [Betaproteobacteria bacterium]|nr:MAG: phytanoyl-CoA dioxygenase family protein [Betaproteobacteria bacterium]
MVRAQSSSQGGRLSAANIDRYRRHGLIVSPTRLSASRLEAMRASVEKLLRDNATLAPESLVCPHIPYGPTHDAAAAAQWFDYATDPAILAMVEQLIGPDIILWGSQVFCKPAGTGKEIPWHQDGQYWPIRPLATCSVWIAIDDATPENGCMRYIDGSHAGSVVMRHRKSDRRDLVLNEEVDPALFDSAKARDDVLEAGQFSLHDVYLIHGSNANRSSKRRAAFVIRYMPATSTFVRHAGDEHRQGEVSFSMSLRPIWLLRGRDRGGNDFSIGHGEDYQLVARVSDEAE